MVSVVHTSTLVAVLDGFAGLGLDADRIKRDLALASVLDDPDAAVPTTKLEELWKRGAAERPVPELALDVGFHVPLGAFGAMDYLAASADTVGAAFRALAAHFAATVPGRSIEIASTGGHYRVTFHCDGAEPLRSLGDEFTIGIVVNHFRTQAAEFPIVRVELTRAKPENPERFAELLGAPVTFSHAVAALELPERAADVPLASRDPLLHRTLHSMSSRLGLSSPTPSLEVAIRHHLREHLPGARIDAQRMARKLGMSERSMHRRLAELGRTYQDVVEGVLRQEAERLLREREIGLAEVALALGFADQSAFSRAFKRWTALTPSQWRAQAR
jgi:AraC-like DNA-binding protein